MGKETKEPFQLKIQELSLEDKNKKSFPFDLVGEKIFMIRIEEDMLPYLKEFRNDYEVRRWCRQVGLLNDYNQESWFESINEDDTVSMYAIISTIDDELTLVGVCGLTSIDYINRRAEFSCYIGSNYRLRGFCSEALYLLFGHGFLDMNLHVIWGETFEHNLARKTFAKIGMKEEGVRRDFYYKEGKYINAVLISMTKNEFKERYLNGN